jgi:hypothetical protein
VSSTPTVGAAVAHNGKTGTVSSTTATTVNIVWGDGSSTLIGVGAGWSWDGDAEVWGYDDSTGYMK